MQGNYGILGTGIWGYSISSSPMASNFHMTYGGSWIDGLSRNYLALLYLPIFPLWLSARAGGRTIHPRRDDLVSIISGIEGIYGTRRARREAAMMPFRRLWIFAFLATCLGAGAGYLVSWQIAPFWDQLPLVAWIAIGIVVLNLIYLYLVRPR